MHAATSEPWCQNLKSDFNDGSVAGELKILAGEPARCAGNIGGKRFVLCWKKKTKENEKVVLFLNGSENCSVHTRTVYIVTRYCS